MPLLDTLFRMWLYTYIPLYVYIKPFIMCGKEKILNVPWEQKLWKTAAIYTEASVRLMMWLAFQWLWTESCKSWAQWSWNTFNVFHRHALPSSIPNPTCLWQLRKSLGMYRASLPTNVKPKDTINWNQMTPISAHMLL